VRPSPRTSPLTLHPYLSRVPKRVVVIGGGLVGLGTAYALVRRQPRLRITVLEKEHWAGAHQSTHNSGVLHAGLHYATGSAKARLAVSGIRAMTAFCREFGIAHDICGKLVVAVSEDEIPRLRALFERGQANGLTGLRWLTPVEAHEIEPHVRCVAALLVPEEGIADYAAVVATLHRLLEGAGAEVRTSAEVRTLTHASGGWRVRAGDAERFADFIVNCAGLHADRVAALAGEPRTCLVVPFRGEYFLLRPERRHLVRNLVYPVPDPAFPFLGLHFTRMIKGGVECGPNAVLALAREGYRITTINPRDAFEALTFPGLWRFLATYPRMAWDEVARSLSKSLFTTALQRLIPELREDDLLPGGSGVRAQAMLPDGTLVNDFLFVERRDALHVLNAPSPAATASLAIGDTLATKIIAALA
jgi:L-2-hydroxyglutarate oxidase